jgi:hypothetical protein
MTLHRISLLILYTITCIFTIYLILAGGAYFGTDIANRPHHALHNDWKPSGVIGHGLGIVGSLLMLILLLYSVRKRYAFMQGWGNIRYWLNYHIWMGITGPILVVFHTAFKFGGIVSVSFWSMVAVALSGVLGRYIYVQIPRTLGGQELSDAELESMDKQLLQSMGSIKGVTEETLRSIEGLSGTGNGQRRDSYATVLVWLKNDLLLPQQLSHLNKTLRVQGNIAPDQIRVLMGLVKQRARLRRRISFLSTARNLLHHWHIIHKPFAVVMLLIMLVHVAVTLLFGYKWIF